eukprot:TRINITY_DN29174_c0_g4_i1.p1 TRINITY_DN29174_c0_g4~~TRINITY_DN29174_c0_g4_i1.p1  ORF type:complete len:195 (+),score=46.72 TRINITY_DN29174_c0_g4_i1:44-628(+)
MASQARSKTRVFLPAVLLIAALWAGSGIVSGALVFVASATGIASTSTSRSQSLVARRGGRDWNSGSTAKKIDFKAAAAAAGAKGSKKKGKDKGPEEKIEPVVHTGSPVIYGGKEVLQINGTLKEYKVDIWSGAHPIWQGKKGKVLLDASALTRFQEKFGGVADIYGDTGLEQVKANQELKKEMEKRKAEGLSVY